MAADYWKSSQYKHWTFTRNELADIREEIESQHSALVKAQPFPDRRLMFIFLRDRILQLAKRLPFRQQCVATAMVYMHRFLLSTPLQNINVYLLVATAFYLASKTEESPHHIRIVASEARNAWQEFIPGDVSRLGEMEFCLISEMSSQLIVWHPYRTLIDLKENQNLKLSSDELGLAWCIVNDSYMTDLPLTCPPFLVAVIAIFLAVVFYPSTRNSGRPGLGGGVDMQSPIGPNNQYTSMGGRPGMGVGMASVMGAMHGLPMNPPSSAASVSQQANGMSGSVRVGGNQPQSLISPDRTQTLAAIASSEKLQNIIKLLVQSDLDIKQMIDGTQELISLYQAWESYNEKEIKDTVSRCTKAGHLDG